MKSLISSSSKFSMPHVVIDEIIGLYLTHLGLKGVPGKVFGLAGGLKAGVQVESQCGESQSSGSRSRAGGMLGGIIRPAPSHNVLLRIDTGLGSTEGLHSTEASAC